MRVLSWQTGYNYGLYISGTIWNTCRLVELEEMTIRKQFGSMKDGALSLRFSLIAGERLKMIGCKCMHMVCQLKGQRDGENNVQEIDKQHPAKEPVAQCKSPHQRCLTSKTSKSCKIMPGVIGTSNGMQEQLAVQRQRVEPVDQ